MAENDLYNIALSKAMALCSGREYCVSDICEKLMTWSVENNDADKIIAALVKENFINEARYANAYVNDKFKYNKWGKLKISAHLKAKKIPYDSIKDALDSIDNDLYINTIKSIMAEHRRSVKAKNQYDLKGKLLRYGLSKGFESNILYDILNDIE